MCANLIQSYYSFRLLVIQSDKAIHNPIEVEIKPEDEDPTATAKISPKEQCQDSSMVDVSLAFVDPIKDELEDADDLQVSVLKDADDSAVPVALVENAYDSAFPALEDAYDSPAPVLEDSYDLPAPISEDDDDEKQVAIETYDQNIFQCKYCDKQFTSKKILRYHECLRFECSICVERLSSEYKLKKHIENAHPNNCKYCDKSFSCSETLRIHLQVIKPILG